MASYTPIKHFAEKYGLRVRSDSRGSLAIRGEGFSHIFEGPGDLLGAWVCVPKMTLRAYWRACDKMFCAGFKVVTEMGQQYFYFDPTNATQAALAIKLTGCRARRKKAVAR